MSPIRRQHRHRHHQQQQQQQQLASPQFNAQGSTSPPTTPTTPTNHPRAAAAAAPAAAAGDGDVGAATAAAPALRVTIILDTFPSVMAAALAEAKKALAELAAVRRDAESAWDELLRAFGETRQSCSKETEFWADLQVGMMRGGDMGG